MAWRRMSGGGGRRNKSSWLEQYDLMGKIGEGTYGLVFLARTKQQPRRRRRRIPIKMFKQSKDSDCVSLNFLIPKALNFLVSKDGVFLARTKQKP